MIVYCLFNFLFLTNSYKGWNFITFKNAYNNLDSFWNDGQTNLLMSMLPNFSWSFLRENEWNMISILLKMNLIEIHSLIFIYWIKNSIHSKFSSFIRRESREKSQLYASKKSISKVSSMKLKENDLFVLRRNWWDKNE
jgi:hypothetical protein